MAALAYLPTALFVALRPLLSFWQAQYVKVFPLKPEPFCKLFAGLASTNKSATSLLFSYYLTLALSSPISPLFGLFFYLNLSGRNFFLSPLVLSGYNGSLDTHSSRETTRLMSWPDGERYSRPLQSFVVSFLLSLVITFIFLGLKAYCVIEFFDPQVSSISTEELVLPRHARCAPSRLRCNRHSLLLSSYLSRIGRIENLSCSACGHPSQGTYHLILHSPATDSLRRSLFGDSLSLLDLWSVPWGVAQHLWLLGPPPCPILRKRSGSNNNTSPTLENGQNCLRSNSSSQIAYVEVEAIEFLRFHFHSPGCDNII